MYLVVFIMTGRQVQGNVCRQGTPRNTSRGPPIDEMDTVMAQKIPYRKQKGSRWNYVDYLRPQK